MSFNSEPEWTKKVTLPQKEEMPCPTCKKVSGNADQVITEMIIASYYNARHIPPTLIFTCDNEDCPDCDEDFEYELSLVVTAISLPINKKKVSR